MSVHVVFVELVDPPRYVPAEMSDAAVGVLCAVGVALGGIVALLRGWRAGR